MNEKTTYLILQFIKVHN